MTGVLIIGGAGVFGSRLAEGLARTGIDVIIAGRNAARAQTAAAKILSRFPQARVTSAVFDSARITGEAIKQTGAGVVVDAAGPYQGAAPLVAAAAIVAGVHYVDLADARDFVAGFPGLDGAARAVGVAALTGASSTPALSHAAIDRLTLGWERIDSIEVAIAPGNRAPRGRSVVAAILSWVGKPVRVFDGGNWRQEPGWSNTRRVKIGDLGRRPVALAETPDLDLLAARYNPTWRARFEAGLELEALHYGLVGAGWLRRLWIVWNLALFAGPARWAADLLFRFGTDRGGMIVEVTGRDANDRPAFGRWTLIAEAGCGPYVPTLAALAAIRRLLAGQVEPGARPCIGVLKLEEIVREAGPHAIRTSDNVVLLSSVFARALGPDFDSLSAAVREVHCAGPVARLAGRGQIIGAANLFGWLAARAAGLPRAIGEVEVEVVIELTGDGREIWRRRFGVRRFTSVLGTSAPSTYWERFGLVSIDLTIQADEDGIDIAVAGWRIGRIPLPRCLAPVAMASEWSDTDGLFVFEVAVSLPLFGRLVGYQGWLTPVGGRFVG